MRLLAKDSGITRSSLSTAVVCGDLEEVERILAAQPDLADAKSGARDWEPILYLCYARLPLPAISANAVAIAKALLDRNANPNAYYMAGDAVYSTLVGVAGEGEQDAARHVQCEALYRLLLERGAELYDIQVLYNTHFHGHLRWWLEPTYDHAVKTGHAGDWKNPDWPMLDMGGYGSGARFCLWTAIRKNHVTLAEWLLAHGANPNAAPPSAPSLAKGSLYEQAVRLECPEIAALLVRYGAASHPIAQDDEDAFIAAARRLDRPVAQGLIEKHPEWLRSTKAIFAAVARDRVDEVALLLELGVPIEIEDEHGQRPLHVAAAHNALSVAGLLLDRGAEVDPRERLWDASPIGFASHHNHLAMIDLLGRVSRTVWILAHQGKIERLRDVLREEPARAREVAPHGVTPLWFLPDDEERAVEVAELFLACGSDPTVRLTDGSTAADAARQQGLDRAADVLSAAAAART
jgi:uncharacterized protein